MSNRCSNKNCSKKPIIRGSVRFFKDEKVVKTEKLNACEKHMLQLLSYIKKEKEKENAKL